MTLLRRLRVLRRRLRSSWRKEAMDAELHKEFLFHLDQLVHENIAEGMPPGEARSAARRTLGNAGLLEEECRDQRRVAWLHDLWQDLCYGARMLRRNPGFSIIAISSLALGIGGNTAILGVMGSVLLGDLSLPHADRLVVIRTFPLENPQQSSNASVPDYLAWKEQSRSFEVMGASLSDQKADWEAFHAGCGLRRTASRSCRRGARHPAEIHQRRWGIPQFTLLTCSKPAGIEDHLPTCSGR